MKTLGGDKVTQSVIEECIKQMGPWVKLSLHVLRSEYPSFELLQSFKIFGLGGKTRLRPGSFSDDVRKLARLVGVDAVETESQLGSVRHLALQMFSSSCKGDVVGA